MAGVAAWSQGRDDNVVFLDLSNLFNVLGPVWLRRGYVARRSLPCGRVHQRCCSDRDFPRKDKTSWHGSGELWGSSDPCLLT